MEPKETYCIKEITARVQVEQRLVKSNQFGLLIQREVSKDLKPLPNGDGEKILTVENKEVVKILSDLSRPEEWLIRIERNQVKTTQYNKDQNGFSDQMIRRRETLERNPDHDYFRKQNSGSVPASLNDAEAEEDEECFELISAKSSYASMEHMETSKKAEAQTILLKEASSSSSNKGSTNGSSSGATAGSEEPPSSSASSESGKSSGYDTLDSKLEKLSKNSDAYGSERYGPTPAPSQASSVKAEEPEKMKIEDHIYEELDSNDGNKSQMSKRSTKEELVNGEFAERLNLKIPQEETNAARNIISGEASNTTFEVVPATQQISGQGRIREVFHMDFSHLIVEREVPRTQ